MSMATSKEIAPKISKEMIQKDGKGPKKQKQPRISKKKGKDLIHKSQAVWRLLQKEETPHQTSLISTPSYKPQQMKKQVQKEEMRPDLNR